VGGVDISCEGFTIIEEPYYGLAPDASIAFSVRFQPTAPDTYFCTIETQTDCGRRGLRRNGRRAGMLDMPTWFDFGAVRIGEHADRDFSITNLGGLRLTGSMTESYPSYQIISGSDRSISAGEIH